MNRRQLEHIIRAAADALVDRSVIRERIERTATAPERQRRALGLLDALAV